MRIQYTRNSKKYEYYVTQDYVDNNLGYDSVVSIKTNGKSFSIPNTSGLVLL